MDYIVISDSDDDDDVATFSFDSFLITTTHVILAHHATQTYKKRPRLTRIGVQMTQQYTQYEYLRFGGTVNAPEKFNCVKVSIDSFFP